MKDNNEIMIYEDKNGITRINVKFSNEYIWVLIYQIADIYNTRRQNIEQYIPIFIKIKNCLKVQLARNPCRFSKKETVMLREI